MDKFSLYEHRVSYYETDQMGIVHHSNYIRWFEDCRFVNEALQKFQKSSPLDKKALT